MTQEKRQVEVIIRHEVPTGQLASEVIEVRRKMAFHWEPVGPGEEGSEFQQAIKDPEEFRKIFGLTIMRGLKEELPRMVDEFLRALEGHKPSGREDSGRSERQKEKRTGSTEDRTRG
jgi:hypothetical protein